MPDSVPVPTPDTAASGAWREAAAAAWHDHQAASRADATSEARDALQALARRLDVLGVTPADSPVVTNDGVVRILLQPPVGVPSGDLQREVWACGRGRHLWLEAGEAIAATPATSQVRAATRLMHAGELATLADVGRALCGDDLQPLEPAEPEGPAELLLTVLRALIADAVDEHVAGRL